jgi:hypothetical protein
MCESIDSFAVVGYKIMNDFNSYVPFLHVFCHVFRSFTALANPPLLNARRGVQVAGQSGPTPTRAPCNMLVCAL